MSAPPPDTAALDRAEASELQELKALEELKTLEELKSIQDISERARAIDPTLDPAFKYIFHDEYLLKGLINRVLHLPPGEQITALTYQESARPPEGTDRRGVIFDLLVTDERGSQYEVEIQRADRGSQLQRVQYYGARLLSAQLKEGEGYGTLKSVRVLMLTRFEMFSDPHPARTYYFTPYLISTESAARPLEERHPYLPSPPPQPPTGEAPMIPFDPAAVSEYPPKSARQQALERRQREVREARELMTFTLIELCKDLSELSAPCQRALGALKPSRRSLAQQEPSPMNTPSPSKAPRGRRKAAQAAQAAQASAPSASPSAVPSAAPTSALTSGASPSVQISEDNWVVAFYKRLERFAGDPIRLAEYERTRKEMLDQTTYINMVRTDAHAVGHSHGLAQGRKEGRQEGRQEGLLRGLEVAMSALLASGKGADEVAALLNLTPQQRAALLPEEVQ